MFSPHDVFILHNVLNISVDHVPYNVLNVCKIVEPR